MIAHLKQYVSAIEKNQDWKPTLLIRAFFDHFQWYFEMQITVPCSAVYPKNISETNNTCVI